LRWLHDYVSTLTRLTVGSAIFTTNHVMMSGAAGDVALPLKAAEQDLTQNKTMSVRRSNILFYQPLDRLLVDTHSTSPSHEHAVAAVATVRVRDLKKKKNFQC
jgi:hypothetical protein